MNRYYSYLVNYDSEMLLLSFDKKNNEDIEKEFNKKLGIKPSETKTLRILSKEFKKENNSDNNHYINRKIYYKKGMTGYKLYLKSYSEKSIDAHFSIFNINYRKFFYKVCDISSSNNNNLKLLELGSLFNYSKINSKLLI